jgi:hypothetical protein
MKYRITNKQNPLYEHEFNGSRVLMVNEYRIWDEDTVGRSYSELDCTPIAKVESIENKRFYWTPMELHIALTEAVTLNSIYAQLLNQYDGGERIIFKNSQEWLQRLETLDII